MAEEAGAAVEAPPAAAPVEAPATPAPESAEPAPVPPAEPHEPDAGVETGAPKPTEPEVSTTHGSFTKKQDSISRGSKKEDTRKPKTSRDFNRWSSKTSRIHHLSTMSFKRGSLASFQERSKVPKLMNTYKLESDKPFNVDKVRSIIVETLGEHIDDTVLYDETMADKAKAICGQIRNKIKDQNFDRYKLIVLTTIGEKKSYDVCSVARFLWDAERDKFALGFAENMYLFCSASAYGLYFE